MDLPCMVYMEYLLLQTDALKNLAYGQTTILLDQKIRKKI